MNLTKFACCLFLTFLVHSSFGQTWPIRAEDDNANWNRISGTFGEIHPTGVDHFHGAIDIDIHSLDCPFYPVDDGDILGIGSISVAMRHNWPENTNNNHRRTRYLHVDEGDIVIGEAVFTTTQLGTIDNNCNNNNPSVCWGDHLHLEMWEFIDGQWYRLNPFNNSQNWTLDVPDDNHDPQINDVILEPLSEEPANIVSGYHIRQTGGGLTQFDGDATVKIHLQDAPGQANEVEYDEDNDHLILYGSIGPIVQARDRSINDLGAGGNGLTVRIIEYSIGEHSDNPNPDQQLKYQIEFNKIGAIWQTTGDDFRDCNSVFHLPYNTNPASNDNPHDDPGCTGCTNRYFGNQDYIELRHLENQTNPDENDNFLNDFHQEIGNVQSNGIWSTKARTGTNPIFEYTPVEIARDNTEALYSDGKYDLSFRAEDEAGNEDEDGFVVTVDNFKPYVKDVELFLVNGRTIYHKYWDFDTNCSGLVFKDADGQVYDYELGVQSLILRVITSEPIENLQVDIPFFNIEDAIPESVSADNTYTFFLGAIDSHNPDADLRMYFSATDLAGNTLLDLSDFTDESCLEMPSRAANNQWSNPDEIPEGEDVTHIIPCYTVGLNTAVVTETHPSACDQSDGGLRLVDASPSGGFEPFIYHWTDEQGNTLDGGLHASNLSAGVYYCVVTDGVGCTGQKRYELIAEDQPTLVHEITGACTDSNNGWIDVWIDPSFDPEATYDFVWQDGTTHTNVRSSMITNVTHTNYCVTITANEGTCVLERCFDVPEVTPVELEINASIVHSCADGVSGSIDVDIEGLGPFQKQWGDTQSTLSNRQNLSTGTYCLTVTDYCGNTASDCYVITTLGEGLNFQTIADCRDEGQILLNIDAAGGNKPFTYLWSDGQTSQNLMNQNTGNHCVTITDVEGCTYSQCVDLVTKDFTAEENDPCIGFNDGSIVLEINNPENEVLSITFQGSIPIDVDNQNGMAQAVISGLSEDTPYTLDIIIGDCSYTYEFNLNGQPTETVFDRQEDDVCFYDEYCNGTLIQEDGVQESVFYNYSAGVSGIFKCYIPGFCREREEAKLKFKQKTVKAFAYQQILNNASSVFPGSLISVRQTMFDQRNTTPCTNIRYCPADLSIKFVGHRWKFNGLIPTDPPCWKLNCELSNPTLCPDDFFPDYLEDPASSPVNCDSRKYNVYQLMVWHDEMQLAFPEYNQQSSLFQFIVNTMNNPELQDQAKCADVVFCRNDFSLLYSNIGELEEYCELNIACESIFLDPNANIEVINCPLPCNEGWCNNSVVINHTFVGAGGFFNGPNGGEFVTQIIPSGNDNTRFSKFAYIFDEGRMSPKGIFSGEHGYWMHDFTIYGEKMELQEAPDLQFFIEDWDNEQQLYIETMATNIRYDLTYEDLNQSWTNELLSDGELEVLHLSKTNESIFVGGTFSEDLWMNATIVANSELRTGFLAELAFNGSLIRLHTVENLDAESQPVFNDTNGIITMAVEPADDWIVVNGTQYPLASNETLLQVDLSGEVPQIDGQLNLDTGFKLLGIGHITGIGTHYLLQGSGAINIGGSNIFSTDTHKLVLCSIDEMGELMALNHYQLPGAFDSGAKLVVTENAGVFVGMNLEGSTMIADEMINSVGNSDILLFHFNANGNLMGYHQYGSVDVEHISDMFFADDLLYFGGSFAGASTQRQIGKHHFINQAGTTENAFISFLEVEEFQVVNPRASNEDELTTSSLEGVNVFPNPFTNEIYVSIDVAKPTAFEIRLYNTLGILVKEINTEVLLGNQSTLKLDELRELSSGIYFIELKNKETREVVSRKLFKQ